MGTSPLPNPQRTPPLGRSGCPDPFWSAGRGLVLQGPQTFLGALWVLTASAEGQAPGPPFFIPEGSIAFIDDTATPPVRAGVSITPSALRPSAVTPEGAIDFMDDTATPPP
jgi:hypothetical protein